jgi:hypothetical protein
MHERILRRLDCLDAAAMPQEMNIPALIFMLERLQTGALFGPCEWAVVHHVCDITEERQSWSMALSAIQIAARPIRALC